MDEQEEEKNGNGSDLNPDALEAALGDDFIEIDEEIEIIKYDDDNDVDIPFSQDDPRDWY